jgi:hypothetical protein
MNNKSIFTPHFTILKDQALQKFKKTTAEE